MFEVEVMSLDMIKPSQPTPDHLRYYNLSFLDQIQDTALMPFVLFFPKQNNNNTFTNEEQHRRLKQSLSQVLTLYYPLAGRLLGDNLRIECNDEGIPYVETRIGCTISDLLRQDLNPKVMNELLGCEIDNAVYFVAVVQVSSFKCGGLAIGIQLSHKIADAQAISTFLNSWAATARAAEADVVRPCFESPSLLFPPCMDLLGFSPTAGIVKENLSARRFVFDAATVAALKEKYERGGNVKCTRVQALSAFLWSRLMASTQWQTEVVAADREQKDNKKKLCSLLHAVNLRPRMDPPLTEAHFGNFSSFALATLPSNETMKDGEHKIINKMRDAIKSVDKEYVNRLRDRDAYLHFLGEFAARVAKEEQIVYNFTNLCRFPFYETDFGWGKPIWVGQASLTYKNLFLLLPTKCDDGIEAWVSLKEEDMKKFEQDKELLAHVKNKKSIILLANL